jgi:hypothetical protein
MSNPSKALNRWQNEGGEDFLSLIDRTGAVLGGIDGTGIAYGNTSANVGYPQFASYTFYVSGGTVYARNNNTGAVDYSGTDAAVVINAVLNANATIGGMLYFKNGIYPINSMILETASGGSNFNGSGSALAYGIGIPSNTLATSVQWVFEGETTAIWQGEAGTTTVNATGVVFNITSDAVNSVAANSVLAGFWSRPQSSCTYGTNPFVNVSNDVTFKNITVRFPTNQRGNTIGFCSYFYISVGYENVVADFNLPYNTIATGSAPVAGSYGSFGITSTTSGSGNWQHFDKTYATGYVYGYDIQSELTVCDGATSIYCTYAGIVGRSGGAGSGTAIYHPIIFVHVIDQECINGWVLGNAFLPGSRIDFLSYDLEYASSGTFMRVNNLVESTPGNSSGIWNGNVIGAGIGISNALGPIFSSGGYNFRVHNAAKMLTSGVVASSNTSAATTGTSKQTLATGTVPAGPISGQGSIFWNNAGGVMRIRAWGITANNSNSKVVEIDFGGTTIASITSTVSSGVIEIGADIVCGANNVQECIGKADDTATRTLTRTSPGIAANAAIVVNLAATTASGAGDFTFKGWIIEYLVGPLG